MEPVLLFCLVTGTVSLSFDEVSTFLPGTGLSEDDYAFIEALPRQRIGHYLPGFKYIFIDTNGTIYNDSTVNVTKLEIAGSPGTTMEAVYTVADVAIKMTRHMPEEFFSLLATTSTVGVFSRAEKLVIFPEYKYLANGDCGSFCNGTCHVTCSADGRKYENVAGLGGIRAVILEDNVLCTNHDPYLHQQNILAHEFSHTIHLHGLTSFWKQEIETAYASAKRNATWGLSSYTMSNSKEYFAEAATVFFGVNKSGRWQTGDINWCGTKLCQTEMEGRQHMNATDPHLFTILSHVFTNDDPTLPLNLTVCPTKLALR